MEETVKALCADSVQHGSQETTLFIRSILNRLNVDSAFLYSKKRGPTPTLPNAHGW